MINATIVAIITSREIPILKYEKNEGFVGAAVFSGATMVGYTSVGTAYSPIPCP
jgi:hypothetical protein